MNLGTFLQDHAVVFDHRYSFFHGHTSSVSAWIIEPHMSVVLEEIANDNIHKCQTRTNVFYTTPFGIVFVSKTDLTGRVFEGVSLKFLYPETLRELLEQKVYYKHTPYNLSIDYFKETKESVLETIATRKANIEAAEKAKALRLQRKQEFTKQCLGGLEPTDQLLRIIDRAWNLDIYTDMSDCGSTYRAGRDATNAVYADLKANGLSVLPLDHRFNTRFDHLSKK